VKNKKFKENQKMEDFFMKKLNLPDFTATDTNSFSFAMTPLDFINGNEDFKDLDGWSRLLYVAMLNRVKLSAKNSENFTDKAGRLYIIFTIEEVMRVCNCGKNSAIKYVKQLEDIGLIEKKLQGLNKPALIYVKNFAYYEIDKKMLSTDEGELSHGGLKNKPQEVYNSNPGSLKDKPPEVYETNRSHTNPKNLERSDNYNINNIRRMTESPTTRLYFPALKMSYDTTDTDVIRTAVQHSIFLKQLRQQHPDAHDELDSYVEAIVSILTSKKQFFRIAKQDIHADVVKPTYAQITDEHIELVMKSIRKSNSKVKHTNAYIQTALFNSIKSLDNLKRQY